jgi:hypothetical protein
VQVSPDADLLAGQRTPQPQLPADQLQVPAGRHQHLQLHRSRITRRRRWVHITGHDQARLAWTALAGTEPRCWDGHGQCLMGPLVVVDLHPGIHRLLGLFQAGERPLGLEQFSPQGLVEPLYLPGGGRRADLGQAVGAPVVPQELFEQHLDPARLGEAAGELDPVVGQDLLGQPLGPPAVDQPDPTHDVHLPQRHRRLALPGPIVAATTAGWGSTSPLRARIRQIVTRDGRGPTPLRSSSQPSRAGPHPGWVRRSWHTAAGAIPAHPGVTLWRETP